MQCKKTIEMQMLNKEALTSRYHHETDHVLPIWCWLMTYGSYVGLAAVVIHKV